MKINFLQSFSLSVLKIVLFFFSLIDDIGYYLNSHIITKKLLNLLIILTLFVGVFVFYKNNVSFFGILNEFSFNKKEEALTTDLNNSVFEEILIEDKPVLIKKIAFPFITARSHLVIDTNTQKILSEHNKNQTFAPASTTKLMTALVALDIYDLNESIEITPSCTQTESTQVWYEVGSFISVKDLLYSLLIGSAGDAACALSTQKVSLEEFVDLMNIKAVELGMNDSHFTNTIGLDGVGGGHYSTSWDLYLLSKEAMKSEVIKDAVKQKTYAFNSTSVPSSSYNVTNTNKLLWEIENTIGVKTGTTMGAGEVLIYRYNEDAIDITIVVMLSENRFSDTVNLLNWSLTSYSWE